MTARRDTTMAPAHDGILDAAEDLITAQGIAAFTFYAVVQRAGVSKGGLLYHFSSKDSLISGLQRRIALRIEETLGQAAARSEPILQAFVRQLRRDYECGGRHFAPFCSLASSRIPARNSNL